MKYLTRIPAISSILLFVSLIFPSDTLTDLTYLNCPDGFTTVSANISTTSSSNPGKDFYSFYATSEHEARVQAIVINGDTQDFDAYLNELMVPYIVFVSLYFIFFMIVTFCSIFEKSCPPCESWKRNFVRRPYEKFQLRCVMIFTLLFAVAIFAICIIMFTALPNLRQQMQYTKCSLYNGLDIVVNGETSENWGGFQQLKNQVGNISSSLQTASQEIGNYFTLDGDGVPNDIWLLEDMEDMKKANLNLYSNNNDSKVTTPNPTTTAATPVTDPLPTVDSLFITTGLGPNGTADTMVTDIDASMQITEKLSDQAYEVVKSAFILTDSASNIETNTNEALNDLTMYEEQLVAVETELNVFSSKYFDSVFDWGLYLIEGVVGFTLAASLLIIIGSVSTQVYDILALRTFVTLGWVIYGLMYFGLVVVLYIYFPVGAVAHTYCQYYDGMLSNVTEFNRLGQSYSQNSFVKLDVCIYGDGNVLEKFSIAQEMDTVTNLFTNIQTYQDFEDTNSVNFVDTSRLTTNLAGWVTAMEKYRDGIYVDSNPSLTTDDNPNFALDNLNDFTNYYDNSGVKDPDCPRDVWVFNEENCTDPNAEVYQTSTEANGLRFTALNDFCLSLGSALQLPVSPPTIPWTQRDWTKRYQQVINECAAYSSIIAYGHSLINYRESRYNLFQGLKDQINALEALNNQFLVDLASYRTRVDTFESSVSTLNNLVTDEISGLLVSSNCTVIQKQLQFTNVVFCQNVMEEAAILGQCTLALLVLMIGGIITASVFSVRFARVEKVESQSRRIVIPEGSNVSETFEKRHRSEDSDSDSSSSSEED